MKKIRTISELSSALDDEYSWRIQEIAAMKKLIRQNDGISKRAILRAGLAITYAHWEGFIKNASVIYASYLSSIGLTFSQIKSCFLGVAARSRISQMAESEKSFTLWSSTMSELVKMPNERVRIDIEPHINKLGNLSYNVFSEIANAIGVDTSFYSTKDKLIDERLVKVRNDIAHGKDMNVDDNEFDDVSHEVISLIQQFKNDIENSVAEKSFLIAANEG